MPAAAKVERNNNNNNGDLSNTDKQDKMASSNNALNVNPSPDQQDPAKIANTIIEKKIRNLEKRKARLLEIKALEDKGQKLVPEQIAAVKKLDSVMEMIDTLKDINKNVTDSLNDYAKKQKKQLKKEQQEKAVERHRHELERLKLLFRIETILPRISFIKQNLPDDDAMKMNEKHFDALESLAMFSEKKIQDLDGFVEKINMILEGNKKEFYSGISHLEMKEIFVKISESDYVCDNKANENEQEKNSVPDPEKSQANVPESETVKEAKEPEIKSNGMEHSASGTANINNKNLTTDIRKDPAVIASGFAYPPYSTVGPVILGTPNVNPMSLYSTHMEPIPTQTFTNQNYAAVYNPAATVVTIPVTIADNNNMAPVDNTVHDQQSNQNGGGSPVNGGGSSRTSSNGEQAIFEKPPTNNSNGTSQENVKNPENDSSDTNGTGNGTFFKRPAYRGGRVGRNFQQSYRGRNNNNNQVGNKNIGYFNGAGGNGNGNYYPSGGNFNGNRPNRGRGGGYHRQQPQARQGGFQQQHHQQNQSAGSASFAPSK